MRVKRAVVMAIQNELGRAGPPLGHETSLLPHPMMPSIVHAKGEAVSRGPGDGRVDSARVPVEPAFPAPALALVWIQRRAVAFHLVHKLTAKRFTVRGQPFDLQQNLHFFPLPHGQGS